MSMPLCFKKRKGQDIKVTHKVKPRYKRKGTRSP